MRHDLLERHLLAFASRGESRRHRQTKMPRIGLIESDRPSGRRPEHSRVCTSAGANRLQCGDRNSALAQESRDQARDDSFANAGVRAGDEDDSLLHASIQ